MITYIHPAAGNLPIKTWVAREVYEVQKVYQSQNLVESTQWLLRHSQPTKTTKVYRATEVPSLENYIGMVGHTVTCTCNSSFLVYFLPPLSHLSESALIPSILCHPYFPLQRVFQRHRVREGWVRGRTNVHVLTTQKFLQTSPPPPPPSPETSICPYMVGWVALYSSISQVLGWEWYSPLPLHQQLL